MSKYLITGISGMDGSAMAELLLYKGHEVHAITRRTSTITSQRYDHLVDPEEKIKTYYCDLNEGLDRLIYEVQPDCIINFAAQSHVKISFEMPIETFNTNALGPLKILEAIRRINPKIRYYNAASSEMFGKSPPTQNMNTPMIPCSPYGVAKLASYNLTKIYREGFGIFASNGILFNHTGPRRGKNFVEAKIVDSAVRIANGKQDKLVLGNLDAKRDFGFSGDYVHCIYKIMTHTEPGDFIVAMGEYYSIKEFLIKVFEKLGLDWKKYVEFDKRYLRPVEVPALMGDPSKTKEILNWKPSYTFDELVDMMIETSQKECETGTLVVTPFDWKHICGD